LELKIDSPDTLGVCANGVDGFQTNDPINLLYISIVSPETFKTIVLYAIKRVLCTKNAMVHTAVPNWKAADKLSFLGFCLRTSVGTTLIKAAQ
jgi:hypothetical protein